ncbi:hypothetical protein [Algoriphagus antarcticus]|uniref:Uncharacterized protein n=1 Tax=Algoriphagus antarcticus TaxID=238540 RepID=A0A3E0D964_9BACT|nr:hypothetical protein [Algoriphagus antarcticus]REG78471.1 hypothetical protein C8N25_1334 [Algoriphagus antarcticus]
MNTKLKKIAKTAAVGIFFMALFLNVKLSLNDPFVAISNDVMAQSNTSGSNPCDAGDEKNFEGCRDRNCTELISFECTFIYAGDLVTLWGRKKTS